MKRCDTLLLIAGAAIFAGTPMVASAQQTTDSQPRSTVSIPVGKDRAVRYRRAERPARAQRPETVTVARTDTVRLQGGVDTVTVNRATTDTVTMTRVDTVVQALAVPRVGGLYFGLAGGATLPTANFNGSDKPGWQAELPLGYDPVGSPVGLRVSVGYGINAPQDWVANIGNAQRMSADADLKLRVVSLTQGGSQLQVYGLGGVSWVRFRDIAEQNAGGQWAVGNSAPASPVAADTTWYSGMGFNAGAGIAIGRGRTNFYVETRFTRFKGVQSNIADLPVLVGITWY